MRLFHSRELGAFLTTRTQQAVAAVDRVPATEIQNSAPDVAASVISKYDFQPLRLDASKPSTESFEAVFMVRDGFNEVVQVKGVGVRATAPLAGDRALLELRPSTWSSKGAPEAAFTQDSITVDIERRELSREDARSLIREAFGHIEMYVNWVNDDLEAWRPKLAHAVRAAVNDRSERLRVGANLDGLFDDE